VSVIILKRWLLRIYYTCTAVLAAGVLAGLLYAVMAGRHAAGAEPFAPATPQSLGAAAGQVGTVLVTWVWPCLVRSAFSVAGTLALLLASVWLLDRSVRAWSKIP